MDCILSSGTLASASSPATRAALEALHPDDPGYNSDTWGPGGTEWERLRSFSPDVDMTISPDDVVEAARSADRTSAGGPSGLTFGHIAHAILDNEDFSALLAN